MCTGFWDRQDVLLVDIMPQGQTINAPAYCEALRKIRRAIQIHNKLRDMLQRDIVPIHNNSRSHKVVMM